MSYEFEIKNDLKKEILDQLEVFHRCELWVSYDIVVDVSSFDHEFGTKKDYQTSIKYPTLRIYFKVGKNIEAEATISDFKMKHFLSHTVYDLLIEKIKADHEHYAISAIEAYNE